MKRLTTIFACVFAIAGLSVSALAQKAPAAGGQAKKEQLQRPNKNKDDAAKDRHFRGGGVIGILSQLNLTDAQKGKVKTILENERKQMKAIHQSTGTKEQKQAKMKALHEATIKQIRAVLTPAQQAKFDAWLKNRKDKPRIK